MSDITNNTIDPKSLLMGWLAGRHITGQRTRQTFVQVACLYNGVRLPNLPEYDKEKYPYVLIWSAPYGVNFEKIGYICNLCPVPPQKENNYIQETTRGVNYGYWFYEPEEGDTNWCHYAEYDWINIQVGGNDCVIWSNFDILSNDGAVYFAKSEDPIPVYDTTDEPNPVLPTGYTLLEYIYSNGTQYIDTGFVPNRDTRIDIVTMPIDFRDVSGPNGVGFVPYGSATDYNDHAFECYSQSSTSDLLGRQFKFNYGDLSKFAGNTIFENQITKITHNKNEVTVSVGDVESTIKFWWDLPEQPSFECPYTMWLFGTHRPSGIISGAMRVYSCKIYDNGILVRDYVPCKDNYGNVGLYDKTNGVFYGNAGTGNFGSGDPKE